MINKKLVIIFLLCVSYNCYAGFLTFAFLPKDVRNEIADDHPSGVDVMVDKIKKEDVCNILLDDILSPDSRKKNETSLVFRFSSSYTNDWDNVSGDTTNRLSDLEYASIGDTLFFNGLKCWESLDYSNAFIWFVKSFENRNFQAAGYVASMYENGLGVIKNTKKAIRLYLIPAIFDDKDALICLSNYSNYILDNANSKKYEYQLFAGVMCYYGIGMMKDKANGIKWLKKAKRNGSKSAVKVLEVLK